jgi:hypothetical protein
MAKNSKFGAAFKAAKASGKKEFSFGGKKFNTKEAVSLPKKGPNPGPGRPSSPAEKTAAMSKIASAVKTMAKEKATKSSNTPIPAKNGTGTAAKTPGKSSMSAGIQARQGFNTTTPAKPYEKQAAERRANAAKSADVAKKKAAMGPPAPTMAQKAAEKSTVGKSPIAVKNQANKKK